MKASYANMKLKINTEVKTFEFNGQTIEVLQYLPAQEKYDLVKATLNKALEGDTYDEVKLNAYFELHLIYMYTNISFTEKQKEDELKLYDAFKSNGFFDLFYEAIDENEYNSLILWLEDMKNKLEKRMTSAAGIINTLVNGLPEEAMEATEIIKNFSPEGFKNVIDFARYANGGRDIFTNEVISDKNEDSDINE